VAILVGICVPVVQASTPAVSNAAILHKWLATYNVAHDVDIRAFNQRYVGSSDIAYALDTREETGGFMLFKIEMDELLKLTALVRERFSKARWQVTITRSSAQTLPSVSLRYQPLPMASQADALSALDAFASRLDAADHFYGVLAVSRNDRMIFGKGWGLAGRVAKTPVSFGVAR
jgi:hypothetical protein